MPASLHLAFPALLDCRPIDAAATLVAAGWQIRDHRVVPLFGLRAEVVRATPRPAGSSVVT